MVFPVYQISSAEGLVIEDGVTRLDSAILIHLLRTLSFSQWHLMDRSQLVRLFGRAEPLPYWLRAGILLMRWCGGHGGRWAVWQWV